MRSELTGCAGEIWRPLAFLFDLDDSRLNILTSGLNLPDVSGSTTSSFAVVDFDLISYPYSPSWPRHGTTVSDGRGAGFGRIGSVVVLVLVLVVAVDGVSLVGDKSDLADRMRVDMTRFEHFLA